MAGHEIITLQFGSFANLTGAHFWNSQALVAELFAHPEWRPYRGCVRPEILHHCTDSHHGSKNRVPRVVIVEDALPRTGGNVVMDAPLPDVSSWGGTVEVHRTHAGENAPPEVQETNQPSQTGPPDEDDANWNTLAKVDFHPRSLALGNCSGTSVTGESSSVCEDIVERVRFFAEACDWVQGFHVLLDESSAWGSTLLPVLQEVWDMFPGRPLFMLSQCPLDVEEMAFGLARTQAVVNRGITVGLFSEEVTLHMPLGQTPESVGQVRMRDLSAMHAAALDCASLPYTLGAQRPGASGALGSPVGSTDLKSYCDLFTGTSTGLVAFSGKFTPNAPLRAPRGSTGQAGSSALTADDLASFSPLVRSKDGCTLAECVAWRGPLANNTAITAEEASGLLDSSLLSEQTRCIRHRCISPLPLCIPQPPPQTNTISSGFPMPDHSEFPGATLTPCLTRTMSTSSFQPALQKVAKDFEWGAKSSWGSSEMARWGLERDDRERVLEAVRRLEAMYDVNGDDVSL